MFMFFPQLFDKGQPPQRSALLQKLTNMGFKVRIVFNLSLWQCIAWAVARYWMGFN